MNTRVEASRAAGHEVLGLAADLSDADAIERLESTTVEQTGRIDIVVNNAGIMPATPLRKLTAAQFRTIMDINVLAPAAVAKASLRALRQSRGTVVNIASIAGSRALPLFGIYAASKAALINLTLTMAQEWAPHGIRVNAVTPGLVETDLVAAVSASEDATRRALANVALNRMGQPEEVARVVRFLVSDEASYCTGAIFPVHGGSAA